MKRYLIVLWVLMVLGCSDGGRELYETARFEEQQQNLPHARALYHEIVEKYPESEFAAKAKERLGKIGQ